jgi:hypothetical protein
MEGIVEEGLARSLSEKYKGSLIYAGAPVIHENFREKMSRNYKNATDPRINIQSSVKVAESVVFFIFEAEVAGLFV